MDSQRLFQSEYLQSRVREKRAESSRNNASLTENATNPSRSAAPNTRDDAIFDYDADALPKQRFNDRHYQSSPIVPHSHNASNSRRTSLYAPNNSTAPRAMGAREMEDHVDKLSKQNFDLKLEVYHRREKIDQLEKQLQDMSALQQDNAELQQVNEDLLQELDKRDQAIDEAVAIICDLEEKLRIVRLFDQQDLRPRTARQQDWQSVDSSSPRRPVRTPSRRRAAPDSHDDKPDTHASRLSVSPTVSARLAELANPRDANQTVPSFIADTRPHTNTLRSMYMHGDTQVRPIPSYTSLASQSVMGEEDTAVEDEPPKSPALSMLSESDFKSLYGDKNLPNVDHEALRFQAMGYAATRPTRSSPTRSQDSRLARTDRWVQDRRVSPSARSDRSSSNHSDPTRYQSLGGVLAQQPELQVSPVRQRHSTKHRDNHESSQPHFLANPIFTHNHLPPTPDTMLTRPSNQSSLSVIQDKSLNDSTPTPLKGYSASLVPDMHDPIFNQPFNASNLLVNGSLLPPEIDANAGYESEGDDAQLRLDSNFGASLFHPDGYNSDSETPLRTRRRPLPSIPREHRLSYNPEQVQSAAPPRDMGSPPRVYARRPSLPASPSSLKHRRSISAHPAEPSAVRLSVADSMSVRNEALSLATIPISRRVHVASHRPRATRTQSSLSTPTKPNADEAQSAPRRVDAIRQRMSKLTRRNSGSTGTSGAGITTKDDAAAGLPSPPPHTTPLVSPTGSAASGVTSNLSRRTRNLFHRRGSSASKPLSPTHHRRKSSGAKTPTSPTHGKGRGAEADGETRSAFLSAAQAAAPALDGLGSKGILTGIPVMGGAGMATEAEKERGSARRG